MKKVAIVFVNTLFVLTSPIWVLPAALAGLALNSNNMRTDLFKSFFWE